MSNTEKDTFYLGITMAGAVSAGSYTGGVLDYLFEALHKWELAKAAKLNGVDKNLVPGHHVVIDAMGGTSAGGMTTAIATLYAIQNKINPVTDKDVHKIGQHRDNLFYDCWVNLDDDDETTTIEKALRNTDLKADPTLHSLLNSTFIDTIAEKTFRLKADDAINPVENIPAYISPDLELLISHTMLRGIPMEVKFSEHSTLNIPPVHTSYEHFLMSHFKLSKKPENLNGNYLWLNPYNKESSNRILNAAVATGAFPVGLLYRELDNAQFPSEYLKTILSRLIDKNMGVATPSIKDKINWNEKMLENYHSVSVDGGAINNEPYGEVRSILNCNHGAPTNQEAGKEYQKYGTIMIDPFPDFANNKKNNDSSPKGLMQVIWHIVITLWDQAKRKRTEVIKQFTDNSFRGQIYPVKHKVKDGKKTGTFEEPLATGMIGGFSGFLSIKYRHHDFYLGRNNARNYIRAFLSLPYNDGSNGEEKNIHPIHRKWTQAQIDKFLITLNGKTYLPIIPDMNMLLDNQSSSSECLTYTIPNMPQMTRNELNKLKIPLKNRIKAIIDVLILQQKKEATSWWKKLLMFVPRWMYKALIKLFRNIGAKALAKKAIDTIYDILAKHKFIEG